MHFERTDAEDRGGRPATGQHPLRRVRSSPSHAAAAGEEIRSARSQSCRRQLMPRAAVRAASRAAIASGPLMIATFRLNRAEWIAPEIASTGIGGRTPPTGITMHAGRPLLANLPWPISRIGAGFSRQAGIRCASRSKGAFAHRAQERKRSLQRNGAGLSPDASACPNLSQLSLRSAVAAARPRLQERGASVNGVEAPPSRPRHQA
jgi:hypothetical protein